MTEQVNSAVGLGQSNQIATPSTSSVSVNPSNVQSPAPRTYNDDDVNHIAATKKRQGYEKGYEAARAELMQQQASAQPVQPNPSQVNAPGGLTPEMQALIDNKISEGLQKKADEHQRTVQQQQIQNVANTFVQKINASKGKIDNLDQIQKDLNLEANPMLWVTAAEFENPGEILKELHDQPQKFAEIISLSNSPAMMKKRMKELADSLKQNEEAEKAPIAKPPLSRQKPSNLGADNGKKQKDLTVSDWQKILRV